MNRLSLWGISSLALFSAFTSVAQAQEAFTAKYVNLRAGPARAYPLVAVLPPRLHIRVYGCLSNYSWCDVQAGPNRGWLYAGNINYPYRNTYEPILGYGSVLGIGVIGFFVGDYWNAHYRHRSWYPDRDQWMHRHPAPQRHPSYSEPRHHMPNVGPRALPPRHDVRPGMRQPEHGQRHAPSSRENRHDGHTPQRHNRDNHERSDHGGHRQDNR
ncbi:MAG TPA: SH3 domain-containing protein [Halothiobacillus sp.]|nr:SH3 domain-containing protein [Halothiobacillus sp.]